MNYDDVVEIKKTFLKEKNSHIILKLYLNQSGIICYSVHVFVKNLIFVML